MMFEAVCARLDTKLQERDQKLDNVARSMEVMVAKNEKTQETPKPAITAASMPAIADTPTTLGVFASGPETTSHQPDVPVKAKTTDKENAKVLTTYSTNVTEAGTNKIECSSHGFKVGMKAMISSPDQQFKQSFSIVKIGSLFSDAAMDHDYPVGSTITEVVEESSRTGATPGSGVWVADKIETALSDVEDIFSKDQSGAATKILSFPIIPTSRNQIVTFRCELKQCIRLLFRTGEDRLRACTLLDLAFTWEPDD